MYRNLLSISIVIILLLVAANVAIADDTTPSAWAISPVNEAIQLGIVPQDVQGNYKQPISREQFSGLIIQTIETIMKKDIEQLLADKHKSLQVNPFKDTSNEDVIAAYHLGIISGKTETAFLPNSSLLRKEAAVIVTRAADVLGRYTYNLDSNFKDQAKIDGWAKNSVDYVANRNIMSGGSKGLFDPNGIYSVEQAIVTALKLYKDDGALHVSKAERDRIAAEGVNRKARTDIGSTIYPKEWLSGVYSKLMVRNVGDLVGYALESKTTIYIDGQYVKSYMVEEKNVIDIDDLKQFGFKIKRDMNNRIITIERDKTASKVSYSDKFDKSDVLVGNTVYTLIANNVRVETHDSRDYDLSLGGGNIPSYTTTTGRTLIAVDFLNLMTNHFQLQGNIAYIARIPAKNEIRLHTLDNQDVQFALGYSQRYWAAHQYPELRDSVLSTKQLQVLDKAESILSQVITPDMGEFEKEKAIYDYLVTYGVYDYNTLYVNHYGDKPNPNLPPSNDNAYNVYGALIDGLAVCAGWADAYQLLFTLAGLESRIEIGRLYGEDHAWVSVRVDDEWYQIEATTKKKKDSRDFYFSTFNFTFEDGDLKGYSGGNKEAVSQKYDYLNEMDYYRDPNKMPADML